jgi:hypothetical protein
LKRQLGAQQRQRMAVQRQAEGTVVGQHLLGLGRCRQHDRRFIEAGGAQHRGGPRVDSGDRPAGLVTVAGEALQRIGLGERLQVALVQRGAAREVLDVRKRAVGPCCDDALGHRVRQAADAVQAEAHRLCGLPGDRLQRALPGAHRDIDRAHLDAMLARIAHRAPAAPAHRSPSAGCSAARPGRHPGDGA